MSQLQNDVRKYMRVARRIQGPVLRFSEFNHKYDTHLPEDKQDALYNKFVRSVNAAKKRDGFPITGPLFNVLKALMPSTSAVVDTSSTVKRAFIPDPSMSLKPTSSRSLTKKIKLTSESIEQVSEMPSSDQMKRIKLSEVSAAEPPYTVAEFKNDLKEWLYYNQKSKLNGETQVVYFVPNKKITDFEYYAAKLTKQTGKTLETGGVFKMRSGKKRELHGLDKKEAANIISLVKSGTRGPFFLTMACPQGHESCEC